MALDAIGFNLRQFLSHSRKKRQHFLAEFAYDGARFHGVQPQPGLRTVGGALVDELCDRFGSAPLGLSFAARTDAGVSARQNFATLWYRDVDPQILNAALETASAGWVTCHDGLHIARLVRLPKALRARNAAVAKRYVYSITEMELEGRHSTAPRPAWKVARRLDLEAMRRAGAHLVGRHDFAAFRAANCSAKTTERQILELEVKRDADLTIAIEADGFLRKMVRIIVGTLVEVGSGTRTPDSIEDVLESKHRARAGVTAPAHPLTLQSIELRLSGTERPCVSVDAEQSKH